MPRSRAAVLLSVVAAAGACVAIRTLPDPRGALLPGQRLVVVVSQSPGPWIISEADSKAEAAAKVSPVGVLLQGVQDDRILAVSKDLQQYLPRPPYGRKVEEALLAGLHAAVSTSTVQSYEQAGITPAKLAAWNVATDQLDWRRRFYAPDPDFPPRDYSRELTLDDALILDVNVSFGTQALDDGRIVPALSADARVYRAGTTQLIWEREETMTDQISSRTLSEFKLEPIELTKRIEALAPGLATAVTSSFVKSFAIVPPAGSPATAAPGAQNAGPQMLVPMSLFTSTDTVPGAPPH